MGFNIRLPNITASTPTEKQMYSYLFQVVEQLNWALGTLESKNENSSAIITEQSENVSPQDAEKTFNSIKALIIKSADIVKAYEETIMTDFNGRYFADSDFGTYLEETSRTISENSTGVKEVYTNVQTITDKVGNLEKETQTTNAYIQRGFLGYDKTTGDAVYGIAVGETNDGVYRRYAWFTADKLSFFDANDDEVAYISQNKLFIKDAAFVGAVQFGGYKADTSDGLAFTWVG